MPPVVDLTGLQNVVGEYTEQHNVIVAAAPLTAAAIARIFITKNKLVSNALFLGGGWVAMRELGGSSLKLIHDQFGYLINLLQGFRG